MSASLMTLVAVSLQPHYHNTATLFAEKILYTCAYVRQECMSAQGSKLKLLDSDCALLRMPEHVRIEHPMRAHWQEMFRCTYSVCKGILLSQFRLSTDSCLIIS